MRAQFPSGGGEMKGHKGTTHLLAVVVTGALLAGGLALDRDGLPGRVGKPHVADRADSRASRAAPRLQNTYGKLPLQFEANRGQTDQRVRYLSRGKGYTLFLTDKAEAVLTLNSPQSKNRESLRTQRSLR